MMCEDLEGNPDTMASIFFLGGGGGGAGAGAGGERNNSSWQRGEIDRHS